MDIEEVLIRKYKGHGAVLYNTKKEAEDSFNYQKIASIVPYLTIGEYFSRGEVIQLILNNKDHLFKVLKEIK